MDNNLSNKQQESLNEAKQIGSEFEVLLMQEGWKRIQAYYQNKVVNFTNEILSSDKPIEEFENDRREIVGIRKIFSFIDNSIKTLKEDKKDDK